MGKIYANIEYRDGHDKDGIDADCCDWSSSIPTLVETGGDDEKAVQKGISDV